MVAETVIQADDTAGDLELFERLVAATRPRPASGGRAGSRRGDQRDRLQRALIELVAEHGLQGVSVRALCARAGVSTRSLYRLYGGSGTQATEACFLDAYDRIVRETLASMQRARTAGRSWREGLQAALRALAVAIARRPERARIVLLEPYGAGEQALRRLAETHRLFEGLLAERFASSPQGQRPPQLLLKAIVGGLARIARQALVEGTADQLPEHVPELLDWTLCLGSPAGARVGELVWRGRGALLSRRVPVAREPRSARERLLLAAAEIAATGGYDRLSEGGLLARAQVPRSVLTEGFASLEDCFIQAVYLRVAHAIAYAAMAARAGEAGLEATYRAALALCTRIAGSPALARLSFVEIFRVGKASVAARERMIRALAELFYGQLDPAQRPTDYAARASVGGLWRIAHEHVVGGRARALPALAGPLSYVLLAPAIGPERALAAIRTAQRRLAAAGPEGAAAPAGLEP